jgi:CheY-like chemotaxis protein
LGVRMNTVLVVEDSFLESYELEYQLKERGYRVDITATFDGAHERFGRLRDDLAAIVCDNRLISGEAVASIFYRYVRTHDPSLPFVVYSAFPPRDLPNDDPLLATVAKPFSDDVIRHVQEMAPLRGERRPSRSITIGRNAA